MQTARRQEIMAHTQRNPKKDFWVKVNEFPVVMMRTTKARMDEAAKYVMQPPQTHVDGWRPSNHNCRSALSTLALLTWIPPLFMMLRDPPSRVCAFFTAM